MSRPRAPKLTLPPYINHVRSKGKDYFYFVKHRGTERAGVAHKIPGHPLLPDGSPNPEWWAVYRQLAGIAEHRKPGSVGALIDAYRASPEWAQLKDSTRTDWTRYLAYVKKAWNDLPVKGIEPKHVVALRDKYADIAPADPKLWRKDPPYKNRVASANNLLRCLSAVFSWSIPRGWRNDNPCDRVKKLKGGDPYAPWLWDEIRLYEEHVPRYMWYPVALALYTGQRESDVLSMSWSAVRDGKISVRKEIDVIDVVQQKTSKNLLIPIHRDLAKVLSEIKQQQRSAPYPSTTILTNSRGRPWTMDGFKSSWQKVMAKPELRILKERRRVFHGLRKSAVVFLLEAGCTDAEVSSVTGQSRKMVEHYSRQVNQLKLAASAIQRWEDVE